jgi:hypothetical protein
MLIPLGILAASGGVAGDYELISTEILGSAQASVTFSSLGTYASTYKHLQIRMTSRTSNAGQAPIVIRFNGVSAPDYDWHHLYGNGSGVVAAANTTRNEIQIRDIPFSSVAANIFAATVIDILEFASTTKNTTTRALHGSVATSNNWISLNSGQYRSTSAITAIEISTVGNFVTGSRFSLYGIKG